MYTHFIYVTYSTILFPMPHSGVRLGRVEKPGPADRAGQRRPGVPVDRHGELGKGQMGSALTGSLANLVILDRDFWWGTPLNLRLSSQKRQGVPFPRIRQKSFLLQRPH